MKNRCGTKAAEMELTVLKIENSFRYCHSLGNYERNDNNEGVRDEYLNAR